MPPPKVSEKLPAISDLDTVSCGSSVKMSTFVASASMPPPVAAEFPLIVVDLMVANGTWTPADRRSPPPRPVASLRLIVDPVSLRSVETEWMPAPLEALLSLMITFSIVASEGPIKTPPPMLPGAAPPRMVMPLSECGENVRSAKTRCTPAPSTVVRDGPLPTTLTSSVRSKSPLALSSFPSSGISMR